MNHNSPSPAPAIIFVLLSYAMLCGCNVGGYPDLGVKLDTLTSIGEDGATAWMRTADDGSSDLLVLGDGPSDDSNRFVLIHLAPTMTGTLKAGTYESTDRYILLTVESEYTKILELDLSPMSRTGSVREDFSPPEEMLFTGSVKNGLLRLQSEGGDDIVMTELWNVIARIDLTTDSGIDMLVRIFNLTTVAVQMRIPGFGGAGLLQYSGGPSEFVGAIDGATSIEMTSVLPAVVEIVFHDFKDFPGITLDGDQISKTDMEGNGNVEGSIHFTMADPRKDRDLHIEGDLSYEVDLTNGTSSDGGNSVVLSTGKERFVPWREAETLDFRTILPPQ